MNTAEFKADRRRVRGLESRSRHLALAFLVLSACGLYSAITLHRFLLAFGFLVAANLLFLWGLSLHRRAREIVDKWTKELER